MSDSRNTVLIMAGGTGGHIFPGLAVADALKGRDINVRWLGAAGGMECQRVPMSNIPIDVMEISGLRGNGMRGWLMAPFRIFNAVRKALAVIKQNKPFCAISFGGYAAGPGGLASRISGVPLVVHEQNRVPGLTNRVLARMASRVLAAFPGTWPQRADVEICGNPVRDTLLEVGEPASRMQGRFGPIHILVTGGSQGALALNRLLPETAAMLEGRHAIEIWHQAGKNRADDVAERYSRMGVNARVEEFIEDMAAALSWADIVICRAGALTVSEIAAVGLASILVPFPHAVDDHQTRNAEFLVEAGAAVLAPEKTTDAESLASTLGELIESRETLLDMATRARSVGVSDAARRVADICMEYQAA